MGTITLTNDSTTYTGRLPTSWADVPLLPYCQLASATTLPERVRATAALVGLPAQPLLDKVRLYAIVARALPAFLRELPPAGSPLAQVTHAGLRYTWEGRLDSLSAGQLEALYTLQDAHAEKPALAAPALLAVLYLPASATAEQYRETGDAFATLPVAVAWPALLDFTRGGLSAAHSSASYSALAGQVNKALDRLEAALPASASCQFWRKPLPWALHQWIKSARGVATTL